MVKFSYKPLSIDDLPLLHKWYTLPHIKKWYSKKSLSYTQLENKYLSYINGKKGIKGFICYLNKEPFGYIQYYSVKKHPWHEHDLGDKLENSAGLDVFIGDGHRLGCGLGRLMIARFISRHIFRQYDHCLVDPESCNKRALQCYLACGFSFHKKLLEEGKSYDLMIKSCPST